MTVDKTQECRLQVGWLFVNGESDELGQFSTAIAGISLRRQLQEVVSEVPGSILRSEDTRQWVIVRNGKGDKDRITVLTDCCRQDLIEQVEEGRQHKRDLEGGFGRIYLPHALERKYSNESREFGWQWVFPSRRLSVDPRSGESRRLDVGEDYFADFFKVVIDRVGLTKNAVPHSLRHVFATHLLKTGSDIRTVQDRWATRTFRQR